MIEATEKQQLLAMLERSGIGHGRRVDYNPPGESIQIECGDDDGEDFTVAEFSFDDSGTLKTVTAYPGELG